MVIIGYKRNMRTLRFYKLRRIIVYAPAILSLIIIGILIPYGNKPDGVEAITDMTGDPSITVTSTNDTANIMIEPTATGTFASTSGNGNIAFSVSTTNYTGYELSARSTKTTLDNGASSLTAITSDLTEEQFSTSSSTTYNNKWGYKPSFYDSTANTKFYGITTTSVVLDVTNEANSTAKDYTIAIGARADLSTPAGSYINDNIILETVANVVPSSNLTVNYGTGVTEVTIAGQTIPDGETVKLIQGVPYVIDMTAEEDYAFDSWDATSGTVNSTSTQNTTYTIGTTNDTLNGYASFTGPDIQNLDAENCTTTASRAKDTRDGHIYTIQRLADGKCWMMENLDLGRTTLTTDLTSANTNLETTVTAETFNGWKKTRGTNTVDAGEFIPVDGTDSTSLTPYGTLYNYYVASAGTVIGSTNTNNTEHDICPAGWRLPTSNFRGEFQTLYSNSAYNTIAKMRAPISNGGAAFALPGYFGNGTPQGIGNSAEYWSSTRLNDYFMYLMSISDSTINTYIGTSRVAGFSIRCVLKKQISDLTYLQDFKTLTKDELNSVTMSIKDNTTYNLIDNRDNRIYTIAKLKDGRIWMAENLDLGRTELTVNLTTDNTNTSESVLAATFNGWKKTTASLTFNDGEYILVDGSDLTSLTPHGVLYNYYSASAGTVSGQTNYKNATDDLCPAGWRLPTGSYASEAATIVLSHYSALQRRSPIASGGAAFSLSGYFTNETNGSPSNKDSVGYYWATTYETPNYNYRPIYYFSETGSSFNSMSRKSGYSIRCIAKKPIHTLTISYDAGIKNITIDGITFNNGDTIKLEEDIRHVIEYSLLAGYSFDNWSATSGNISTSSMHNKIYAIGTNDATLSAITQKLTIGNLQDVTPATCPTTASFATDIRDGHEYIIKKLADDNCWMMENLDLGKTTLTADLTSANTNLTNTITASTFNSWIKTIGTQSYTDPELIPLTASNTSDGLETDSTSVTPYGTLYNYCAASAGTICNSTNSDNAQHDICPAGWRLPIGGNTGEFRALSQQTNYNNFTKMRNPIMSGGAAFALAGLFSGTTAVPNNAPNNQGSYGFYWSSSVNNDTTMYILYIYTSGMNTTNNVGRSGGYSIRCIAKKPSHTLTVSYDSGVTGVIINGNAVANGDTISLEEGVSYPINLTTVSNYTFDSWSATSGTVGSTSTQSTTYTIGTENATLTATTTFTGPDIQNLSSSNCTTTASQAKDNRDGHIYTIQRLADGKCWMMENLDLGRTTLTTSLTSSNTNLSASVAASTFNGWIKTSGTNSYTAGELIPVTGTDSTSGTPYGTLYNYCAASAGTICSSSNSSDASYDLCPAGWRLPTGGSSGEFTTLYTQYNSWALMRASIANGGAAFTLAGQVTSGIPFWDGNYGYYWTSTRYNDTSMGMLYLRNDISTVYPDDGLARTAGESIRCVLK